MARLPGYNECFAAYGARFVFGAGFRRRPARGATAGFLQAFGASLRQDGPRQLLTINDNLNVRLSIARCCASKRCKSWKFQFHSRFKSDVTICARLAPGNTTILDYFCIPKSPEMPWQITVSTLTPPPPGVDRFSDLAFLRDLARWGRRPR